MRRKLFVGILPEFLLFSVLLAAALPCNALEVYTNRDLWLAELHGAPDMEDFESESPGYETTPFETAHGVLLDSLGEPLLLGVVEGNWINGTQGLHYRDFGNQLLWVLPDGYAVHAFGFDYDTDNNDWEVIIRGQSHALPASTTGFFGVVDREYSLASFITTCDAFAQGGLLVDNLSTSDQVWGDLLVFTDPAAWEAYTVPPIAMEDFESDVPGTYDLPYSTGHGFALNYLVSPITIQILDVYMNGTQGLHYRDFDRQMEWRFPNAMSVTAFGFDYDTDDNNWQLQVAGETITLHSNAIGFIGVVQTSGLMDSFVTTCSALAQGGMSVDNVRYTASTTAVEPTNWSRIKSLY